MKKVICFGDFLVSLSPPGYYRFIQINQPDMFHTGAKANVAASTAQ